METGPGRVYVHAEVICVDLPLPDLDILSVTVRFMNPYQRDFMLLDSDGWMKFGYTSDSMVSPGPSTALPSSLEASPYHVGAVIENHYHSSSGYTIVIAAQLFLPILLPQSATPSFSKMQVTLPPGPIQVGHERVYRQNMSSCRYICMMLTHVLSYWLTAYDRQGIYAP